MAPFQWFQYLLLASATSAVQGNSLWSTRFANFTDIIRTAYPIGNGQLAALPFGEPGREKLSLNKDSLWSGGLFENASYNGGNPEAPVYSALPGIRDWIFQNGTGNVSALMGSNGNYGSYYVLGNLSVSLQGISGADAYRRMLDLDTGVHTTTFHVANASYTSNVYCSYPDNVCVYEVSSTAGLPSIEVSFENGQANISLVKASCSNLSRSAFLSGITQADIGMTYKAEARVLGGAESVSCSNLTGVLTIEPSHTQRSFYILVAAGTDYDQSKGTAADGYTFRGEDPGSNIAAIVAKAALKGSDVLKKAHIRDYSALMGRFTLNLPDTQGSAERETAAVIEAYNVTNNTYNDPWLESFQFQYGRHLFISSSREGSLPPNLQGKWAYGLSNAWGADYHANINLQMNHWGVDQTGLGELQSSLWTYMAETWAPRGSETAKLLYNASEGWVVHDEMNVFGHTGMKTGEEYWADYPASAAWMMLHVADHYDYSMDMDWLREIGYPMLKAISQFWLSQLIEDEYFRDGTLVVNPCSSPEHGPTTFACTHYQQLLHSLFTNTLQAATAVAEADRTFTSSLFRVLKDLDKGLHISPGNLIQEWKLPLPAFENTTHRHLSHLVGWFPGSSLSSYLSGYNNATISTAVTNSLIARGPGIEDANAGWEKVWRAACWARLNNTEMAYSELRLTLKENIADNLLSLYSGKQEPFQIDANFGYVGAVLSMLVVDLPKAVGDSKVRTVVLGPAIPDAWAGGSVEGLRLRGGGIVNFEWDGEGVVTAATWIAKGLEEVRVVNKNDQVLL